MRSTRFRIFILLALAIPAGAFAALGKTDPGLFVQPEIKPALPSIEHRPRGKDAPIVLESEDLAYDQKNDIVIARGKVEFLQGDYVMMADQITYFKKRDLVVAEGNVTVLQPSGDVLFADRFELNDVLKIGVINAFKARMADDSVLVADRAVKKSASITKLKNASYTPCNICEGVAPFWQLNADDLRLDELSERVTYHDATIDMFGVPLFYTPYLSHPSPAAPGQSGFLTPLYQNNSSFGTVVKLPYYWRIAPDKDMLLTPSYSSQEGPMLIGDYHQLTDTGEHRITASATYPQRLDSAGNAIGGNEFRGHIFAKGETPATDDIQLGYDIQRATDDTYLRRYGFGDESVLFSRVYAEAAENRNYARIQALSIQGLRTTDDARTTPLIFPAIQTYAETTPDDHNIRYHLSTDAQSLTRTEGIDQRRVSMTAGATMPYVTDGGHIFKTTVNLRQDVYQTDNLPITGTTQVEDATTSRTLPQAALEWNYPLSRQFSAGTMTVEPLVMGVLQSSGGNPSTISNEDSRLLELTDTNLFSLDRMPGLDLVDGGARVAYGVRGQYLFNDGTSMDALLGQNYNADSSPFPNSTTPGDHYSDYIGRLAWNISPVTLTYRFAIDNSTLATNRNELGIIYNTPWINISTAYRSVNNNSFLGSSKEGDADITLPLSQNWSIYGGTRRNLDLNQFVTANSGIIYKNECFNINLDALRNFSRDRDVTPSTQVMLRVAFKNLGQFGGSTQFGGTN